MTACVGACPVHCHAASQDTVPPEPPVGTWVKDKHGGTSQRQRDGWGEPGIMPFGRWEAMWRARGPLVECGPWGGAVRPHNNQFHRVRD